MTASSARRQRRFRRRTLRVLVEYVSDAGVCCDRATTLGAGGLFIETEMPLPEGSQIKLRFQVPGSEARHEIEGRVVWSRRPAERSAYGPGMGIEFTDRAASSRLAEELEALD